MTIETIAVPRWWIKHVRDKMLEMELPSGPVGDFIFIFREQLGDILEKPTDAANSNGQ